MLLLGEKELADQLLALTKTARKQESTIPEQGRILHEMGGLYLKDAIETGNGEQFVKASALINAALVRAENENDQKTLQRILYDIRKSFMKTIGCDASGLSFDLFVNNTSSNKDILHALRVEIDQSCDNIKPSFDSNAFTSTSETWYLQWKLERQLIEEVKTVSGKVQTKMLEFVKRLWGQATECFSVPPPCKYSVFGLGSLARQETTPYSDLEFALLIERDSEEIKQYYKNLVFLFHLLILDLGETPIPGVAIESLNDFTSSNGDKFFDGLTPRGFRLDGAMPWACKTPLGRKETPQMEPLDLIKTPEEMAALLKEDNVLGQAYRVADILCNSIFICGDLDVYNTFIYSRKDVLSKINHKNRAKLSLIRDYNQTPDWHTLRYGLFNLQTKKMFYRLPSSFVENLRIYFTPDYQSNSNWEILDHLLEQKILSIGGVVQLRLLLSICYGLRLLTYLKNRGQYESFRFPIKTQSSFNKVRPQNPFEARSRCRVAHFGSYEIFEGGMSAGYNILRDVIARRFLNEICEEIDNLCDEQFAHCDSSTHLRWHYLSWPRTKNIIGNLAWARSTHELPSSGCGTTCGVEKLCDFSHTLLQDFPGLLRGIDELLDIKGCKCLSLLRTNLLVSKAFLIKGCNMKGKIPKEANISELLKIYRKTPYQNVRERFYLLFDLSELARFDLNKRVQMSIADEIQTYIDQISTFQESDKIMVNMMKDELLMKLSFLYEWTEQFDKGFKLCEQHIDEYEREFGLEGITTHTGAWYVLMGELKLAIGFSSEALWYYEKALDHLWYLYSNTPFNILKLPIDSEKSGIKYQMEAIRILALKVARLYVSQNRNQETIKLLTKVLTKNDKTFDIETNDDIQALCILSWLCKERLTGYKSEEYIQKGNQYFEDILEIIIANETQLHVSTVLRVINMIHTWNARDGKLKYQRGRSYNTYVIAKIFRKYCTGNSVALTKTEFMMKIMGQILDNESFQQNFITTAISPDAIFLKPSTLNAWDGFLFHLCETSMPVGSVINFLIPQRAEFRRALLHQAGIFCDKVVKKIVPDNIYNMCVIYIDFQRIKMNVFDFVFTNDRKYIESAKTLAVKAQLDLRQYFPECPNALRGIQGEEFVKVEHVVRFW